MPGLQNNNQLTAFTQMPFRCKDNQTDDFNRFEIHPLDWMNTKNPSAGELPEKLTQIELIWIKKGRGQIEVDGKKNVFADNTVYCITPGRLRRYSIEPGMFGYYLKFTNEFIRLSEAYSKTAAWFDRYQMHSHFAPISISCEIQCELETILQKMKQEYTNYDTGRTELLKGLLNVFMIYLSRNVQATSTENLFSGEMEIVRKFMALINRNYRSKKMVSDYAHDLLVTPNHLNRIVKKITGFSASHHIQQLIMLEAKRQAMYPTLSMKEIAYDLGFDNLAHFSKFFKNNCGKNFTEFKKEIHNHA
ncbi:helix-turn-helix domain-containing protein [Longitalea arenae]|uniref:helix-turn-helix domain-containing protein n=1 Tax=Longitalea arenae TaxID=2812558 RepID=UPI001967998B|nr:helix-turn-helix domain-containing protein [Longitalea arenae]